MTVSGFYNNFRPLLEYEATNQIKDFLECCWQPYQQNKEKRKLSAVIEYLLQCDKPGQPLEARILFISIVLESLKSTYAHENGYKFDGTGFLTDVQQDKKLKCKDDTKCKNRYMSFRNLLEKMLAEVGIQVELTDIIRLRNEVFHNGLSEKCYEHMTKTYDAAQDIVREYLLKLLGYNGSYWVYSTACRQKKC